MAQTIYAIMRQKRNTYAWFQQNNPILEDGQIGIISSGQYQNCFKIGDGVTGWNALPWVTDYHILFNKPRINGVELSGNVSLDQLGTASINALNTETAARTSADSTLQGNIDAEEAAREAVGTALATEIVVRQQLAQALDGETAARQSGDALKANIESPHLSGIPTTPDASGDEPEQIINFRTVTTLLDDVYDVLDMILPDLLVTQAGDSICTQNGEALIIRNYT
jgi:hypothetical protein